MTQYLSAHNQKPKHKNNNKYKKLHNHHHHIFISDTWSIVRERKRKKNADDAHNLLTNDYTSTLVISWCLTSLSSTNMAISETNISN